MQSRSVVSEGQVQNEWSFVSALPYNVTGLYLGRGIHFIVQAKNFPHSFQFVNNSTPALRLPALRMCRRGCFYGKAHGIFLMGVASYSY